jgi:hypothetical protein
MRQRHKLRPDVVADFDRLLSKGMMPHLDPDTLTVIWVVEKPGDSRKHFGPDEPPDTEELCNAST